ncbi:MAG: DUF935 family protein [Verrucomicrobiae bacterium]|nr:DUF935 family protein [Verrucomicrobiae bacterium]
MNILRLFRRSAPRSEPLRAAAKGAELGTDRLTPSEPQRWGTMVPAKPTPLYIRSILDQALAGDLGLQGELFAVMQDTWPRLRKNLHELRSGAARARYNVAPATPAHGTDPTPGATDRAELVRTTLCQWSPEPGTDETGFEDTLYDLCEALGSGISVIELLWERGSIGPGRTAIRPRAGVWVPPRHLLWTPAGRLAMRPVEDRAPAVPLADDKWLVGIHKSGSGQAAGYGLLRPLAWWWGAAQWGREWLLNYAQIFGQPFRWATYVPGMPGHDLQTLNEMLDRMGASSRAAFPEGVTLSFLEAKGTAADNPQRVLIELADKACDVLLLGQTLTTDVADSGSRALGDVHEGVRRERVQQLAQWVADVLNYQLVPAICRHNYGDTDECPTVAPDFTETPDPDKLAGRMEVMTRIGLRIPVAWAHDILGVPMPEGDEPVLPGPPAAAPPPMPGGQAAEPLPEDGIEARAAAPARRTHPEALDAIIPAAIARVTDARARWLEPLGETMDELIAAARDERLDDQALDRFLREAASNLPDLFAQLDHDALAGALEDALGAAALAGVKRK